MKKLSTSELSRLTGFARETVAKRLIDMESTVRGNAKLYDSMVALPLLYGYQSDSLYDLTEQRARLTYHQAENEFLKEQENKGALVRAADVLAAWQMKIAATRAQLLSMPSKAAPMAFTATSPHEVEGIIRGIVFEALDELAGSGLPAGFEDRLDEP